MMIKKTAREGRTDDQACTCHRELLEHAIKLLGSEQRVRAMIAAGTLHLLIPNEQREPDRRRKPCDALARLATAVGAAASFTAA